MAVVILALASGEEGMAKRVNKTVQLRRKRFNRKRKDIAGEKEGIGFSRTWPVERREENEGRLVCWRPPP